MRGPSFDKLRTAEFVCCAAEAIVELLQTSLGGLHGNLASAVDALLDEAFPDRTPGKQSYHSEHGTPALILLLWDRERVLGHLAVYQREVEIGAETFSIGMIGGVAVASSHRGMGLARTLLAQARTHLAVQSIPFSVLFAYEPAVYASSGYKLMLNETHFLDGDGLWKTFVYRGSMYAELSSKPWPNKLLDLRGRVV